MHQSITINLSKPSLLSAGTYILKGGPVEEAQTLLDDHIVKTQAMAASPFAAPFEDIIGPWEKKLIRLQVGCLEECC